MAIKEAFGARLADKVVFAVTSVLYGVAYLDGPAFAVEVIRHAASRTAVMICLTGSGQTALPIR